MKATLVFAGLVSLVCLWSCESVPDKGQETSDSGLASKSPAETRPEQKAAKRTGPAGEFLGRPYEASLPNPKMGFSGRFRVVINEDSASFLAELSPSHIVLGEPGGLPILAVVNTNQTVHVLQHEAIRSIQPDKSDRWGDYYQLKDIDRLVVAKPGSWVETFTSQAIERKGSSIHVTWGDPTAVGKVLGMSHSGSTTYDVRSEGFKLVGESANYELQD